MPLFQFYIKHYSILKNNHKFKHLLNLSYEAYKLKKRRLKLGLVVFDFKEIKFNNITIIQWFEMNFIRQPVTQLEKKRFEGIWNFISWAWDFKNVTSLVLVVALVTIQIKSLISVKFMEIFPTFVENVDIIKINNSTVLNLTFQPMVGSESPVVKENITDFSNLVADLCTYFNILF